MTRAVSSARLSLRQGECAICMDTDPTISLLCCGLPVHLICISKWRSTNNQLSAKNCPCCRYEIREIGYSDRYVIILLCTFY